MIKRLLIILFLVFAQMSVFAQDPDSTAIEQFMKLGKRQVEIGAYKAADLTFRKVLNLRTFVPDELTYYYGNTLYQLRNYRLSESFLSKYLELNDSTASFFDTTTVLLSIVKGKIRQINACEECDEDGFKIDNIECHVCTGDGVEIGPCDQCNGLGEEVCKVCLGEKVEIQRTSFGRRYIPCTNCEETGFVECKKCKGEKKLEYKCHLCSGSGLLSRRIRVVD